MKHPFNRNKIAYLFFILTLFLTLSCSSDDETTIPVVNEYLSIPDSHFEILLVEQGIDSDGSVDQQMLRSDAEKVSRLDLNLFSHFGEISDLTGIEGFENITFLSAVGQEIEDIDLSFNTKLDTLLLTANYLTSIDLSNNPHLVYVDLQANEFSADSSIVGLSNATNLKELDLSWNYVEDFSIHNGSLEILHMSNNDLVSIDTDGAVNLQHILLTSNKLEMVDFSTNVSLETLLISDNNLEHIDLENSKSLTHLYSSSNLLAGLDVSHNQELIDLRVDRNPGLTCIKILSSQEIPTVSLSDYQELSDTCN
jgi:protein phosphatase 1 regulatory subunit 7